MYDSNSLTKHRYRLNDGYAGLLRVRSFVRLRARWLAAHKAQPEAVENDTHVTGVEETPVWAIAAQSKATRCTLYRNGRLDHLD